MRKPRHGARSGSLDCDFGGSADRFKKGFFAFQNVKQVGTRIVQNMIVNDHPTINWQSLELDGYLVGVSEGVRLIAADLGYGPATAVLHPDSKTVFQSSLRGADALKVIDIGPIGRHPATQLGT